MAPASAAFSSGADPYPMKIAREARRRIAAPLELTLAPSHVSNVGTNPGKAKGEMGLIQSRARLLGS
jgi:hypothetical protein